MNEKTSDAEMDDIYELVMLARSDNKLWKSGLDSSYKTFIANKPSPNMKAVLLSILWTAISDCVWTVCDISCQYCELWTDIVWYLCSYLTIVIEPMNIDEAFCFHFQPFLLPTTTTFTITYQVYQSTINLENSIYFTRKCHLF